MNSLEPIVSVIVTNWNGRVLLERCLQSLLAQSLKPIEIILVDNASTDGSVELVENRFPSVRVLRLPENQGHAGPVNLGFRAAHPAARFLVKMDNDARAEPDWLEQLVHAVEEDPSIGSAACRTLDYDRPELIYSLGDGFLPNGDAFNIARGLRYQPDLPMPRWVFGASGCTAFYRRAALDRVGFLDEDFWAYHEDVDLDFRLQLAGYKCLFVPGAVAYHAGSVTGKRLGDRLAFISGRNRCFVLIKNLPLPLWIRFAWPLAYRQAQLFWWGLKGNRECLIRCWGALGSLRYLFRESRKRRAIGQTRRISSDEVAGILHAHEQLQQQLKRWADSGPPPASSPGLGEPRGPGRL